MERPLCAGSSVGRPHSLTHGVTCSQWDLVCSHPQNCSHGSHPGPSPPTLPVPSWPPAASGTAGPSLLPQSIIFSWLLDHAYPNFPLPSSLPSLFPPLVVPPGPLVLHHLCADDGHILKHHSGACGECSIKGKNRNWGNFLEATAILQAKEDIVLVWTFLSTSSQWSLPGHPI